MNQIVGRFEGPLVLYATRLLGGDVNRARDAVQETFMRLWQGSIENGPDPALNGHLAAWLYRVCRNACLDVRRKESRMTTLTEEHHSATQCNDASISGAGDESGGIVALMRALPESQQEAVRLKFQGQLSYAEIAQVMDITVNHVGVLIHTALKTIRQHANATQTNSSGERSQS